jgi:hypothetical protein
MASGTHSESCQIGSAVKNRTVTKTFDNEAHYGDATSPIVLAAGLTVTAWVKSTSLTGTCTLPAGHGYGAAPTVDVYGSDGTLYAYGVVCSVATNALTFASGGTAVNSGFPASATVGMIVCKQQRVYPLTIDGASAAMTSVLMTAIGHVDFQDSGNASVRALSLAAAEASNWDSDQAVNPWIGNVITQAYISNGTIVVGTFSVDVGQDSTP